MKKACGYLRVSTEAQAGQDRYSFDCQKSEIEAFAAQGDFEIVAWFTDAGVSGSKLSRPGINDCLDQAGRHAFDVVIVAKLDRFSRDLMGSLWLRKEFLRHGVQVLSVAEPFDENDAAGRLLMQIVSCFAEFEKARITERLSSCRKEKAKQGGYSGGNSPIGYTTKRGNKALAVDLVGAESVQRVFTLKAEGLNMSAIAAIMNQEGRTTKQGTQWRCEQVRRVLDRQALYRGAYGYSGITAAQGQQQAILRG